MTATPNTAALTALLERVDAGDEEGMMQATRVLGSAARDVGDLFPGHDIMKAYSGSLDAAKALHEAVLPGWIWWVGNGGASVISPDDFLDPASDPCTGHSDISARAWLIAILRALIATPDTEGR